MGVKMSNIKFDDTELAERYDAVSDSQYKKGLILIEQMGIKSGDHVLDVGCGTGRMALHVSEIVGPSGSVFGVDPSPYRIKVAQEKLKTKSIKNVRFEIGRGEDMGTLSADAFDHVYFCSVFHWIEDKPAALAGAFRVLRPGGTIGMTTGDRDEPSSIRGITNKVLSRPPYLGQVKASEDASKPTTMKELEVLLSEAGFTDIDIKHKPVNKTFPTPEKAFEFNEASSFGNFLKHVPEHLRTQVRHDIAEELEKLRTPGGIEVATNSVFAIAKKPL
jgi:arsenite methyltransferase